MSLVQGNATLEGQLATYFLHHLNDLSSMTLKKCMQDVGVSKASIHRFYSKAGFDSFKGFMNVLSVENDFNHQKLDLSDDNSLLNKDQVDLLMIDLEHAKRILFYGNLYDIVNLYPMINELRSLYKYVQVLGMWDIELVIEQLSQLQRDDIFVLVDSTIKIQNYHEMSMNNHYIINFNQLNACHKYYIGEGNVDQYLDFHNIKLSGTSHLQSLLQLNHMIIKNIRKE